MTPRPQGIQEASDPGTFGALGDEVQALGNRLPLSLNFSSLPLQSDILSSWPKAKHLSWPRQNSGSLRLFLISCMSV